jgi:replicative DNA helicase
LSLNKILNGREDAREWEKDFFSAVGDRMSILDKGGFVEDVASIRRYVENYQARNGGQIVVIVDYLQATATNDGKAENTAIADAVKGLKQLAKDCACPVLTASSMARTTYNDGVSFSSFYGSSMVEFSADAVLGLQYAVIDSPLWNDFQPNAKEADKKEKRARLIDAAESESPRKIYLCGLKYRGNDPHVKIPIIFDAKHFDIREAEKPFVFKAAGNTGNNENLSWRQIKDLCDDGKPAP